jgi:DNA-binding transcriptional ArsR family regulator
MTYERILAALADPTRRQILEAMARGPQSVAALAEALPVSRPAVSQHLKVLSDAGLLEMRRAGTRRLYRIAPGGAVALRDYLDRLWSEALAAYAAAAETPTTGDDP